MYTTLCYSFYDRESPIYTMSRYLPPSKVVDAQVDHSILGDGCCVRSGSKITNSVIGLRTLIQVRVCPLIVIHLPSPIHMCQCIRKIALWRTR